MKDRHREIRAASIDTVSRNFGAILFEESLDIIRKGLEDRAAYVRLEAVECVRSTMAVLPEPLVLRALEVNNELRNYSGWLISYFASITYNDFKEKVEERLRAKHNACG